MKICTTCQVEKPTDQFYKRRTKADGSTHYHAACKSCHYAQVKARLEKSPEAKTKRAASLKAHDTRAHRKLQIRRTNWKRYGMDPDEAERVYLASNGICAICKNSDPASRNMHVDHCHRTGKVRAVLCTRCNTILGMAKDSQQLLSLAIEYLDKFEEPVTSDRN